ncbi:glycosyltransferase [uncultured Thiodictyon sp.]|uniref:glycosyltransferase n=1 Tax=uncultured Thiodictyon sp. TaxID=1846217 RepID=UPI0025DA3E52|nr:glycosyltransferase [uncultured Thiodictyon sp.]
MRISVVIASFTITGVSLAQLRFARALAKRGHDVDLVIGYLNSQHTMPVVENVRLLVWNKPKARGMLLPMMQYLRVAKPDLVFSAEDHLNAVVLLAAILSASNAKISGSSRVLPSDILAYSNKAFSKGWFLKQAMKAVMWRADAMTCVSKDMVEHYRDIFRAPPHVCVYNIVVDKQSLARALEPVDEEWVIRGRYPIVVAAGTLDTRKGFADLINALSILSKRRLVRLVIFGEGPLRAALEDLIVKLGLTDVVTLPGNVDNPLKYFRHADAFVLSSYAEGMPNVLVEAMMCGCTPVATDCPTGPRELLHDGRCGYLVPLGDPAAMSAAIERALENPIPGELLAEAVQPFEEGAVIERHFELLGVTG